MVFLALVSLLNARGIKKSLRINVGMTPIELTSLVIVMVAGAYLLSKGGGDMSRVLAFPADTSAASATLAGAVIAYYAFVGFKTSANVAEEMQNPGRSYAPALFGSLLVAGLVYVGVGLAADMAMPRWLFSFIALIAVANGALLTMIMTSRLTHGMADEGLEVHRRRQDACPQVEVREHQVGERRQTEQLIRADGRVGQALAPGEPLEGAREFGEDHLVDPARPLELLLVEGAQVFRDEAAAHHLRHIDRFPARRVQADRRDKVLSKPDSVAADRGERAPAERAVGPDGDGCAVPVEADLARTVKCVRLLRSTLGDE